QDKFMPYKVMQLNKDGSTQVYAAIESPAQQM
ncbi:MAG TPA: ATP-binding protein, partial [Psychrobacter sp.]|nr:ATP-binding protein [Psychrobacter sp.]